MMRLYLGNIPPGLESEKSFPFVPGFDVDQLCMFNEEEIRTLKQIIAAAYGKIYGPKNQKRWGLCWWTTCMVWGGFWYRHTLI